MVIEELNFKEFINTVKRVNDTRNHKVKNSLGVYDSYKWIRRNKWYDIPRPLKELEFYRIIRRVNLYLADELSKGKDIKLPHKLGTLEIRKKPSRLAIIDSKLVTNLPIDWDATLKLWNEDVESYNNKTIVRVENEEIFKVYYNKNKADFTNKSFYEFKPNREIKHKLTQLARTGKLDAFIFKKYD